LLKAFFKSKEWALWAYGGLSLLIISLWIQVQFSVGFNSWYGRFYNLLQDSGSYVDNSSEGISLFYGHLVSLSYINNNFTGEASFLLLVIPYTVIAVFTSWFTSVYALRWRQAITFNYIPRWKHVETDIEGASQRIQEDCYRFARIVESLGLQIVRALMTLIAFIPILWGLSDKVDIPYLRDIEGSLVWVALTVSLGGLFISWFVGWYLPGLEYNNQKVEAAFRKKLVLAEDDKTYAEPEKLWELFTGIRFNYHRLFKHYAYFNLWMYTYDRIMIVVPYLIVGPGLFTGLIMLGIVTQVSNAFQQVHGGFSLFLHNWTTITELRSIWRRLTEFEKNLTLYENKSTKLSEKS